MKRKVVKLGPSTLVVSLPTNYIKNNHIKIGQDVEVEEHGRNLIISSKAQRSLEKEEIDISKMPTLIKRYFVAKYIKGADEIKINIKNIEQARIIQKRTDELLGMEVIDQKKNSLTLRELGSIEEENYDAIIKRTMHLLQTLSNDILESLKTNQTSIEYLIDIEKRINRFTDYCYRLLNKKGYKDHEKTPIMYCITYLLEMLGDEYQRLLQNLGQTTATKETKDIYEKINIYHKIFSKVFFDFTLEGAIDIAKERDSIQKEIDSRLNKTKSVKEAIILKNLENINRIIIDIICELLVFS